jgi:predicted acetyltransferase
MTTNNEINKERHRLYDAYIKELGRYDTELLHETPAARWKWCEDYITDPDAYWLDIADDTDSLCGFLIISSSAADCHPVCDYYICQAYVCPDMRGKGLMTKTALSFITAHRGTYGYDVLKGNRKADRFWKSLFAKLNALPIGLALIRNEDIEKKLKIHGYIVA